MALKYNDQAVTRYVKDLAKLRKSGLASVEGVDGLCVVVSARGAAAYVLRYQVGKGADRIWRKQVLGKHGLITLADARAAALKLMRQRELGSDPIADGRRQAKSTSTACTLKALWEQRVARDTAITKSSLTRYQALLDKDVFPVLGNRAADEITDDEFADLLSKIEARAVSSAHNVKAALSGTYRWARQRRLVKKNPLSGLGFNYTSKSRNRVATDGELTRLWAAFDCPEFDSEEGTKIALKLNVLLGQRGGELVGAECSELQLDGPAPRWTLRHGYRRVL